MESSAGLNNLRSIKPRRFVISLSGSSKKPFDLISCRNVMIYFDSDTKTALIERLYDATKPGGYFFIGHAENIQKNTRYEFIKAAIFRRSL